MLVNNVGLKNIPSTLSRQEVPPGSFDKFCQSFASVYLVDENLSKTFLANINYFFQHVSISTVVPIFCKIWIAARDVHYGTFRSSGKFRNLISNPECRILFQNNLLGAKWLIAYRFRTLISDHTTY